MKARPRSAVARVAASALIAAGIAVPALAIGATAASAATCSTLAVAPVPNAGEDIPYYDQLQASGGTAPYTFTNAVGVPRGMTLTSSGVLTGIPIIVATSNGEYVAVMTYDVTDANGCSQPVETDFQILTTPRYLRALYDSYYPTVGPILRELQALVLGLLCPQGCPIK